jgi:hypothetical protein
MPSLADAPVLRSSLKENRIVDIEPAATKTKETPEEKLAIEKVRGATCNSSQSWVENTNLTECISSIFTQGRGLGGGGDLNQRDG